MIRRLCLGVVTSLIITLIALEVFYVSKTKHPNANLSITQLVSKQGYPIETHEITTTDGYILTLHRIPHGRYCTSQTRTPVLFMHGFSQSATDFVNTGPDKALSFLLANKGYDVWLGNARGTTWSKKHQILNSSDREFWDFSLHEIALFDVSAFIDYILNKTRQDALHYVGYSQGTSLFFILASELPEYKEKVRLMTALAPAIFLRDPHSPILYFAAYFKNVIEFLLDLFTVGEFLAANGLLAKYLNYICNENSFFVNICLHSLFLVQGYNPEETNKTELSVMFSNSPAGVSPKQMLHIAQLFVSGEFHQYDFGLENNLEKYQQAKPPRYDISNVTTAVALYYSRNDWTVNIKNIDRIHRALPNIVKSYEVPMKTFNHNDFIYARNVVDLLYKTVMEEISKY